MPVQIAGVWPWSFPYSSIIQAITWAFVLTSGAGMSRVGPRTFWTLSMNDLVIAWSSERSSSFAGQLTPPLAPPNGIPTTAVFQVISEASAPHLVDVDLGMEPNAALVGAACAVVLDPVAGVDVDLAVGLLDRDLDGDLAIGSPEDDPEVIGELQSVGGEIEVVADDLEVRHLSALPVLRLRAPAAACSVAVWGGRGSLPASLAISVSGIWILGSLAAPQSSHNPEGSASGPPP